jgi:hypothetical protein
MYNCCIPPRSNFLFCTVDIEHKLYTSHNRLNNSAKVLLLNESPEQLYQYLERAMFTEASEVAPLLCFVTFTNTTFTNTISRTDQSRIWRIRLDTNGGVVVTSAVVASPTSFTFTNSTFTGAVVGTAAYPSIVTLTGEVVTLTLI